MRLDMRQGVHQFVAQPVDAPGKPAGELFLRRRQGQLGARMDHVGHRLGLREINTTVQKRALRKLAGPGGPRAGGQHRFQHPTRRQQSAMTGNLHRVLAGERARRPQHRDQHLIHHLSGLDDPAEMHRVRGRTRQRHRGLAGRRKHRSPTAQAAGPEMRTTASPPSPSGVAMAAIVSSNMRTSSAPPPGISSRAGGRQWSNLVGGSDKPERSSEFQVSCLRRGRRGRQASLKCSAPPENCEFRVASCEFARVREVGVRGLSRPSSGRSTLNHQPST